MEELVTAIKGIDAQLGFMSIIIAMQTVVIAITATVRK